MAEDKKGKGSGTKDACYHKVKSRYSVWPSAYASGALVKCRKVGAKNWGNKSESFEMQEGGNFMRAKDSQIARSTGAGALTPDAAKQLGKKAEELQKKKAAKVDLPKIEKEDKKKLKGIGEGFVDPEQGETPSGRSPLENVSDHPKASVRKKAVKNFKKQMGKEYGGKWKSRSNDPVKEEVEIAEGDKYDDVGKQATRMSLLNNPGPRSTPEQTAAKKARLEKKRGMKLDDHPQYKEEVEHVDEAFPKVKGTLNPWEDPKTGKSKIKLVTDPKTGKPKEITREEVDKRRAPAELVARLSAKREGHMAQDGPNKAAYDAKQRILKKTKDKMTEEIVRSILDEAGKKCWKGYKKAGTQKLFGKTYNRCVKANEEVEVAEEKRKDHEFSMARSQLKTLKNAAGRLEKKMGKKGEGELKAWVQSKITKAADYIDTAADYVTNEETEVTEGRAEDAQASLAKVKDRQKVLDAHEKKTGKKLDITKTPEYKSHKQNFPGAKRTGKKVPGAKETPLETHNRRVNKTTARIVDHGYTSKEKKEVESMAKHASRYD